MIVAMAALWIVSFRPGLSQANDLFAHVDPLGGDRYRVTATWMTDSHPFHAVAELHEVGVHDDTLTLEPELTHVGNVVGATVWPWNASLEIEVPNQVRQIELRSGPQHIFLQIQRTASQEISRILRLAITNGDTITFVYNSRRVVGRPQRIYVADNNGDILQCNTRTDDGKARDTSFYVARMTQVEVNPPIPAGR
jgi:hypothetical protein